VTYARLDPTGERLIPDIDQGNWNVDVHRSRYSYAATFTQPTWAILDYGCGTGYGLQQLASATQGICVGVDKLEAVAYAQERYPAPNIQYVAADVTKPGARFGKFDLIVSFDVIEHLEDIDTYVANIAAQLRDDDSLAILSTPWSLRRNNLRPWHNPHHTCDLSAMEFVQHLERHLQIEEFTLTMGMLARVRRKGAQVRSFDAQTVTITASVLAELEDYIETYSQRYEQAELLRHDLALLSQRASRKGLARGALRRAGQALRTAVAVDRSTYRCLQMYGAQTYTANLTGEESGLVGFDLMLAMPDQLHGGDICLALYDGDTCVAQASKPAVLLSNNIPSRFLFPVLPESKGGRYRLQIMHASPASTHKLKIWCTAQGEPCFRALYRRYEWPGPPRLMPAPRLLAGTDNLPPLPVIADQALDRYITHHDQGPQAQLSRMQKLRRAYGQEGLAGIVRTVQEYIRWRLRH
jgi:2-polyprenyl-3-methyl-5-hydroxy-6-metoxy-1,4-benzoquinol methylase